MHTEDSRTRRELWLVGRRRWKPGAWAACGLAGMVTVLVRRRHARLLAYNTSGTGPGVLTDGGVLLHVETEGPAAAPLTVVFVHGFSACMDEYQYQRSFLSGDFRLVFFDQRGHGRSGWGGHRFATMYQLGRDLGRIIDECTGSGPVVVVGHSLGAMAVMELARARTELFGAKVVAVGLISTSAGRIALGAPAPVARLLFSTGAIRTLSWVLWYCAPLTDRLALFRTPVARRMLRRQLFGLDPAPEHMVSQMQQMWAGTSRAMAAAFYPGMLAHDTTQALSALSPIPSLVLTGGADNTIPAQHSHHIAAGIGSKARLIRVPRAGHMVNVTHADTVNDALRWLLRQAMPSAASSARPFETSCDTSSTEGGA